MKRSVSPVPEVGGPSTYSSVFVLPDRSLGILFEKDDHTRITFMRVEEQWLWDPGVDTDNDGMPDAWETFHGNDPGQLDADEDSDGDASSNLEEYEAGTDPGNAASVFRLRLGEGGTTSLLELVWNSVPGRHYLVQSSMNLDLWDDLEDVTAVAEETSVTVERPPGRAFFRVLTL